MIMRQFKLLVLSLLCITAVGGAALKAAGAGVNVTKAITTYDIAGNTVMSTQAGVDMVENGVDAQNALQLLAGIGGTGTAIYSNKSVLSLSDIETPALQVGGVDMPNNGLGKPQGITFEAEVYRAVNPRFADTVFDFHAPSNLGASHRYTDVGRGGIYSGTSKDAVLGELAHYGIDPTKAAWVTKNIKVNNVLDLTNSTVRSQLGVSLEQLTGGSYKYTHALGDFARGQGYGGILFPSARAKGTTNFVELINHAP